MAATNDLIPDFEDFERYRSGEMPPAEQRVLEGRMLAEPLVAEAYEGFLAWRQLNTGAGSVHADLQERLHTRVTYARRSALPLWAYASAASVLLVMLSYWAVFVRDRKVDLQEHSVAVTREKEASSLLEQAPAPIREDQPHEPAAPGAAAQKASTPAASAAASQPKQSPKTLTKPETISAPSTLADVLAGEEPIDITLHDSIAAGTEIAQAPPSPAKILAAPGAAQAVGKSMAGRVRMETSSLYTVAQKGKEIDTLALTDGIAAQPAGGWPAYRAYLERNTGSASIAGQVVVTFIVGSSGELSEFIAKGPQELQKMAIRIISTGPAWTPAHTKAGALTSPVEIQLQFRQSP